MPTPIGHALGGLIAGWIAGRPSAQPSLLRQGAWLLAIGAAADLDFLIGRHRAETHSLGAVVIVASAAAAMRWPVATSRLHIWLVVAAAWGSHVLLDALGADSRPPHGVMAFWPVSTAYYKVEWDIFLPVWRQWWEPGFLAHSVATLVRELLLLGPPAVAVTWWRARSGRPRRGCASR
jgi:membrane-bound metal-dependent hydrolase YbcI (DUF457 family)